MTLHTVQGLVSGAIQPGTQVLVRGWVRTRRDSKAGISFIQLADGTTVAPLQIVAPESLPNYASEVLHLSSGCAIAVRGALAESEGKGQRFEVRADRIEVVGWVDDPDSYPIQPKAHSHEFLREVAHLRPRTATFGAVARLRHRLSQAIHRFFDEQGFYWVHTPIIT